MQDIERPVLYSVSASIKYPKNGIEVFKEYPLFGIGVNAYEDFMVTVMPENNIFLPLSHAHNSFLMHLITFGIFGFITFCLFYGKIIFDLVKNIFNSPYAFCGAAVMAGYFIEALTEYNTGLSMSCKVIKPCKHIIICNYINKRTY